MLKPSKNQLKYLRCGISQPGGKLPLFDDLGQEIDMRTIRACVRAGWAEPWFSNPLKPEWLVCRLTGRGRDLLEVEIASAAKMAADPVAASPVVANPVAVDPIAVD